MTFLSAEQFAQMTENHQNGTNGTLEFHKDVLKTTLGMYGGILTDYLEGTAPLPQLQVHKIGNYEGYCIGGFLFNLMYIYKDLLDALIAGDVDLYCKLDKQYRELQYNMQHDIVPRTHETLESCIFYDSNPTTENFLDNMKGAGIEELFESMFGGMANYKDKYDIAEEKYANYFPTDPDSPEEFFEATKDKGVVEVIVCKNYCYIKLNTSGDMVPPDIHAIGQKFNFEQSYGSGTGQSALYYARACKHAKRKIS